jgi:heptosyltransferase-3
MTGFKGVDNILAIKLRHIGDVLLAVPAIRALKEGFPGARVSALVNSGTEEMLTLNPLLDEVMCFDRTVKAAPIAGRISAELLLVKELRKRRFDMTADFTGGDRAALLGLLSGARYRLAYDPNGDGFAGKKRLYTHVAPAPGPGTHTVARDLGLLRAFGIDTPDLTVDLYTSPEDDRRAGQLLDDAGIRPGEPFALVHPCSRWGFKCWSDSGMAAVMDRLGHRGLRVVVTSGPGASELKKVRSIVGLMKTRPIDLSGALTLKGLASIATRAVLFFGVDTAPMHIAAAVGTPVVAVFGPSGSFDWGPWDNRRATEAGAGRTRYRMRNGVQTSGAHTVVQKGWGCIPCGRAGCEDGGISRCLEDLEVDVVWDSVSRALASGEWACI